MTYAVMQTGLEPPTAEQLKHAFHAVPELTAMDVNVLGKDAYGVLVKGFEHERASAMQSALAAQGVETEIVDDAVLAKLPPPRQLAKVQFTPEALLIDDLMGRNFPLVWKEISVIAAGRVRLTDFTTDLVNKVVWKSAGRDQGIKLVTASVTKEEQKDHLLLEILTRDAARRYHVKADRPEAQLLFKCLGGRYTRDSAVNLALFVQELAKCAPAAILNHGAFYMRDGGDLSYTYPSQTAFYREITWLLWMAASGRAQT
jgi:hypothetical protein